MDDIPLLRYYAPYIILGFTIIVLITVIKLFRSWWKLRKSIKDAKNKAETMKTINGNPEKKYKSIEEFFYDLPDYCVDEAPISKTVRRLMEKIGIEFEQHVVLDPSGGESKQFWLPRKGLTFVHQGGWYAKPSDWPTHGIIYHFLHDLRPIGDRGKDPDWYNPDAVADVWYGQVNTAWSEGQKAGEQKMLFWIAIGIGIMVLIAIAFSYSGMKQEGENAKIIIDLLNKAGS